MIRVLGGTIRGKKLFGPKGLQFRPATGQVKNFIFSYLGEKVEQAHLLDLFAGTGSIGIEALSRGAMQVVFIERAISSLRLLKRNLETCDFAKKAVPLYGDVFLLLPVLSRKFGNFDIVIADPPFSQTWREPIVKMIDDNALLQPGGCLIIEHDIRDPDLKDHHMTMLKQKRFGHCVVSIYA